MPADPQRSKVSSHIYSWTLSSLVRPGLGLKNHPPFSAHAEAERTDNRPMKFRTVALYRKRERRKSRFQNPGARVSAPAAGSNFLRFRTISAPFHPRGRCGWGKPRSGSGVLKEPQKLLEITPGETVPNRGQESDPIPTACHDVFATWTLPRLCGAGGPRPEARAGKKFTPCASPPSNLVSPPTRFRFHFVTIPPFSRHSTSLACHANT